MATTADYVTHWCRLCGACTHPATGCVYTENFIVCRNCTVEGWRWLQRRNFGKGGRKGLYFYEHVTSKA